MIVLFAALLAAPADSDPKASRVAMATYIRCLVTRQGFRMRTLLKKEVSGRTTAEWASLATQSCLADTAGESELRFRPTLMRGAVYEELFRKDFGRAGLIEISKVGPISFPFSANASDLAALRYRLEMSIGECAVRHSPAEARTLIGSIVASPAEANAIKALTPALSACVQRDNTLTLSKSVIRGFVAESLYRLTAAAQKVDDA